MRLAIRPRWACQSTGLGLGGYRAGFTGAVPVIQTQRQQVGSNQIPVIMGHPALAFHKIRVSLLNLSRGPISWKANDIFYLHFKCVEFKLSKTTQTTTPTAAAPNTYVGASDSFANNSANSLDPSVKNGAGCPVPASSNKATTGNGNGG